MASNFLNPLRGRNTSTDGGGGYNSVSAGRKAYGAGRPFPNTGKAGTTARQGYNERDARRNAIMKRQGRV